MKRLLILLFLPFLIGCKQQKPLDYDSFPDRVIGFKELFNQNHDDYYVYIFSYSCGHCEDFKEEVLNIIKNNETMYLVKYSKEIKISSNVDNTIGAKSVEEVSILGTPTLLEIRDRTLVTNVAGKTEIRKIVSSL